MMKFLVMMGLWIGVSVQAKEATIYKYVITETGKPTSLDPLNADQTQNLPVARMLYATPIELDAKDELKSAVLRSFSYNAQRREMTLILKSGLQFSDGSAITIQDLEMAILRMAAKRPQFPVLEKIKGLDSWIKNPAPLESRPEGVIVKGNELVIHFASDVAHPLVRLSLELFSIIPVRCIDKKTMAVTCENIPSSGPYVTASPIGDKILFKKRPHNSTEFENIPDQIEFQYVDALKISASPANFADNHTVVAGNQMQFEPDALEKLNAGGKVAELPTARFNGLLINPEVKPFNDQGCRRAVANSFRKAFAELSKGQFSTESSLFGKLLPGYMSARALESGSKETPSCREEIPLVRWGFDKTEAESLFVRVMRKAFSDLGWKTVEVPLESRQALADAFVSNQISFMAGGSGFWAFDPSGDLQMLFTPNLHKPLQFISRDEKFQKLILNARETEAPKAFDKVNQYLYDQGLFNIYVHARRFYWSPNRNFLKDVTFSSTAPAPWQVFL